MMTRLRRWLTYRALLAQAMDEAEGRGYKVSVAALERMRREAREAAGYRQAV